MIRTWIKDFIDTDRETQWFIMTWIIYGSVIVLTAIYCYARLDFVRSYESKPLPSELTPSK